MNSSIGPVSDPKMRILITGDKGFVGTETKKYIAQVADVDVIGYDIMDTADIRDYDQLERVVESTQPHRVLHLAAIARFADADANPVLAHETNVVGTQNVVEVCKKYNIPLVYASTGSAYMPIELEPPIKETFPVRGNSVYGCTKALGEKYVQEHTPHIILRYGHLYGKEKRHHGLIGGFMDRIKRGMDPILYGGKQSNDFCYIKDVARANWIALTAPWDKWNQAYNVGSGEELSAEEAGKLICKVAGYDGKIEKRQGRTVDASRFVYDMTKSKTMLGFEAEYSFEDGLRDMFS